MRLAKLFFVISVPALFLVAIFTVFQVQASPNSSFTVNSTVDAVDFNPGDGTCETGADNDICTLRAAIQETNALPGEDTILLAATTYTLTLGGTFEDESAVGDLDILDDLQIIGIDAANTIIDGGRLDRIFHIPATVSISVKFDKINVLNGITTQDGGGLKIESDETHVFLSDSIIKDNVAPNGHGVSNSGYLTVTNSSFLENLVLSGGGGPLMNRGQLYIRDSTFMHNDTYFGGGVYNLSGESHI